jgi:hypothetical protein
VPLEQPKADSHIKLFLDMYGNYDIIEEGQAENK